MRVYLDDIRKAPPGWRLVTTPDEAIKLLMTDKVTDISLDHDLGDDIKIGTGYGVVLWIEREMFFGRFKAPRIKVHSANPPARKRMEAGIQHIEEMMKGIKK